ncbi:flagellar hook-basal body complex protein, partial [Campylobacterota bacterium]
MLQSIYAGVSSLQSFQTGIDVLANNIANVNTVGFKGSTTEFSNLFEKEISTAGNAITSTQSGLGVRVGATALDMKTGSYFQTDRSTDLSIRGDDGWFGLLGSNDEMFFSRAGNFGYDAYLPQATSSSNESLSRLVNPEG